MNNEPKLILSIDNDEYLLSPTLTDAEKLMLLKVLSGVRKADSRANYIPDENSEYATSATVLDDKAVDVTLKLTFGPVLTRAEFRSQRTEGKRRYDEAHKAVEVSAVEVATASDPVV